MQKMKLVADSVVISLTKRARHYLNVKCFRAFFAMYSWSFKLSTEESGFVQSKTTNGDAEKKVQTVSQLFHPQVYVFTSKYTILLLT